jgi:hypothetical protein
MAAGKWKAYNLTKKRIGDGTFDLEDTADWKCALFLSTSNANTLSVGTAVYGDLTNEHANASGYTTGGVAVTGVTWIESGGVVTFDCDNVAFNASGGDIAGRFGVLYKDATVNGVVKPLLCVSLLNTAPADVTALDGNPLNINMHASGVLALSGAAVD